MMRHQRFILALFFSGGLASSAFCDSRPPVAAAIALREAGDFKGADAVLDKAIAEARRSGAERKELEWERDRSERIRQDFSLTKEQLFKQMHKSVRNLTRAEFESWNAEGRFESRTIDGALRFVGVSVRNLFYRYPDLNSRRIDPPDSRDQRERLNVIRAVKEAAIAEHKPYVLSHDFKCTMTITADKNTAPDGEVIRCWIPVPRVYPFQSDFKILNSSSPVKSLAPENSSIRSVYLEQPAKKNQPTKFEITYTYRAAGVHFELDPAKIQSIASSDPALKRYTTEAPHIVFTDRIKQLARDIGGQQTNAMLKAKGFYDWVATNLQYSLSLEYSTFTNIPEYTLNHRYGDCGMQAMLFMTLCRSEGIPARWQSGWYIAPGSVDNHDWSEIYLAPYGWMPVDPCFGNSANRYCPTLTPAERREMSDFYFGGLDPYRMAANSDHSQELNPPKKTMRSDDVDFQRGELESGETNIYLGKFHYAMKVEELKPARERPE